MYTTIFISLLSSAPPDYRHALPREAIRIRPQQWHGQSHVHAAYWNKLTAYGNLVIAVS